MVSFSVLFIRNVTGLLQFQPSFCGLLLCPEPDLPSMDCTQRWVIEKENWVGVMIFPSYGFMTLDKSLPISCPQFLHLWNNMVELNNIRGSFILLILRQNTFPKTSLQQCWRGLHAQLEVILVKNWNFLIKDKLRVFSLSLKMYEYTWLQNTW